MKLVRYSFGAGSGRGVIVADAIHVLEQLGDTIAPGDRVCALQEARLLAPVQPGKVVAVGKNYREHAAEMNMPVPEEPVLFIKPSTSVVGPLDGVVYPPSSARVDYEAELAIVIGRRAHNVLPENARDVILGYTCGNDVTARDLQQKDGQWTRSKSFDTFCPLGPWIVTDLDPAAVMVQARLNGQTRQRASTATMIVDVFHLLSFVSHVMTLEVDDVIMTGTPAGIGPMGVGDVIEIEVEGIGVLRNAVVAPDAVGC